MDNGFTESGPPVRRYWAFISYSHRDTTCADWLFRSIEGYRIPGRLVGSQGRDGPIPSRLAPIFRDRDELPTSHDLGAQIKNNLANSRYLIVICSRRAARSRWVDEEVRTFKKAHGEGRSICLLIDGEPNASDDPETAALECMPIAVRYTVGADGSVTNERVEPIAADIRHKKDGRDRALLKIIAGMLGVNFDELWQRDRRRRRRQIIGGVLAFCVFTLLTYLYYNWERRHWAILQQVAAAEDEVSESHHRLGAAKVFAAAWLAGERGSRVERDLQDAAKALVTPSAVLKTGTAWLTSAVFVGENQVVTTGWDHMVRLWNLNGLSSRTIAREDAGVTSVCFASGSPAFCDAELSGALRYYASESASPLDLMAANGKGGRMNWVSFSPDGRRLVCASDDGTAVVFNIPPVSPAAPALRISGHDGNVKSAAFSADGKSIVTASLDYTAKVWDAQSGTRLRTLVPETGVVNDAVFSPDGRTVATACLDGSALIWDNAVPVTKPQKRLLTIPVHPGRRVNSVAFSPDGSQLATACDDNTAQLWNVSTGELILSYEGDEDYIISVAFSPDGKKLVSAGKDGIATVIPTTVQKRTDDEIVAAIQDLPGPAVRAQ